MLSITLLKCLSVCLCMRARGMGAGGLGRGGGSRLSYGVLGSVMNLSHFVRRRFKR